MKSNMNMPDRGLRLLFGAIVAVLYLTGILAGTMALVLGIAAAVLALTSIINFCPIYYILGISSRKKEADL